MNIERTVFVLLLYISSLISVKGQDPVFSQITSQPLLANPAFAGLHSGEIRASLQFKTQSDLPSLSYKNQLSAFGIDTRYKAGRQDFWTLQGLISSFKIGDPSFVHQKVSLGGGYLKLLKAGRYGKGTQYLSLAFQVGLEQTSLASNTWFSNQYDPKIGGVDRATLTFLMDAFTEDEAPNSKGEMEKRAVLKLDYRLAPIKVAVLPLSRNADLSPKARDLAEKLRKNWNIDFDDAGAIGRRYRRQDEIGTPYCITVDFETLEDHAVTIRDRDTMAQERIALDQVEAWLAPRLLGC